MKRGGNDAQWTIIFNINLDLTIYKIFLTVQSCNNRKFDSRYAFSIYLLNKERKPGRKC